MVCTQLNLLEIHGKAWKRVLVISPVPTEPKEKDEQVK